MRQGKYFRILSDVYIDDKSLTQMLIAAKHVCPYAGGSRKG